CLRVSVMRLTSGGVRPSRLFMKGEQMTVSPNIVIMTKDELEAVKREAFQRGVRRGEFEIGSKNCRGAMGTPSKRKRLEKRVHRVSVGVAVALLAAMPAAALGALIWIIAR